MYGCNTYASCQYVQQAHSVDINNIWSQENETNISINNIVKAQKLLNLYKITKK